MGKKYIIELNDECNSEFKGIMVFGLTQEKQISVELIPEESLTPYTEPDLDAIRNETWEAARKIGSNSMCSLEEMGFDFGQCVVNDYNPSWYVVKNYSASECIEKIRQYEQKEEKIQVGDEVIAASGKAVVMGVGPVYFEYVYANGHIGSDKVKNVKKTGRHFPEIAEVLEKMRGE